MHQIRVTQHEIVTQAILAHSRPYIQAMVGGLHVEKNNGDQREAQHNRPIQVCGYAQIDIRPPRHQ